MNMLHLKYAVEVAKTKSISKAAENLFMGQPNLSRAIKELETRLGICIFERGMRGITLTPEGEEFLKYAEKIVAQMDELESMYDGKGNDRKLPACVVNGILSEEAATNSAVLDAVTGRGANIGIIRYELPEDEEYKNIFVKKGLGFRRLGRLKYTLSDFEAVNTEKITKDLTYEVVAVWREGYVLSAEDNSFIKEINGFERKNNSDLTFLQQ